MRSGAARSAVVVDEALEAGMRRFGASQDEIAQVRRERGAAQAQDPDVCEVLQESWPVWQFFLRAQTQWRYVSGGMAPPMKVALDYAGIEAVARIRGVAPQQLEVWADDLQTIELAVLQAENELAARRSRRA